MQKTIVKGFRLLTTLAALALSGCGGGNNSQSTPAPPYISATVSFFEAGPRAEIAAWVYSDLDHAAAVSNAVITANTTSIPYDLGSCRYFKMMPGAEGSKVNINVAAGGVTYTATGTQYVSPAIVSGTAWQANSENQITWSPRALTVAGFALDPTAAPDSNAEYRLTILDNLGNVVYPQGGSPLFVPETVHSVVVPANTLTAGTYQVLLGVVTVGAGIPFELQGAAATTTTAAAPAVPASAGWTAPVTAPGSGLRLQSFSATVQITVQ